jgi:hypothetical protein
MDFDWQSMEFYHYAAFAGLGVVVLALLVYFLRGGKLKVPAIISCGLGCLVAGIAVGVISLSAFGYQWKPQPAQATPAPAPGGGGPSGMMGMGGGPGGGMGMGPGGPGGGGARGGGGRGGPGGGAPGIAAFGGGGRPPSPKRQLASLVEKLELVANKPVTIELNDAERKQVLEHLKGLKDVEDLPEEDAKKRLDALLLLLEKQKDTLQLVGFRWPGAGGGPGGGGGFGGGGFTSGPGGGGQDVPNPFKEEARAKALEALESRLGKTK